MGARRVKMPIEDAPAPYRPWHSLQPGGDRRVEYARRLNEYLEKNGDKRFRLDGPGTQSLAAWFLGPKAENAVLFEQLVHMVLTEAFRYRTQYSEHFNDPAFVTDDRRKEPDFAHSVTALGNELDGLLTRLKDSVPFFSYRYQAHMNWDLTMAGMLGYFAAMLFNQNNVALEASPVTSQLESEVGKDLCRMLGFPFPTSPTEVPPWGHITCDGSVANLEAMWAARNLKYYPFALAAALRDGVPELAPAKDISVPVYGEPRARALVGMDIWTLLNLPIDEVLKLNQRLDSDYHISAPVLSKALDGFLLQNIGFDELGRLAREVYKEQLPAPVIIGPATKHYSWPKGASILGIGKNQFSDVPVDSDARMDLGALRACLERHLTKGDRFFRRPVLMTVAVLGSTEESAVDPLAGVLGLRDEYRARGLEFVVHVDAAWGGYFASLLRKEPATDGALKAAAPLPPQDTPVLDLSDHVRTQYQALPGADSVTIDPHKAGYIPYPAGGLCYRKKTMRDMVTFMASEVYHGHEELDASVGVFGVEGSKPGAAAAATYLSHRVIRPNSSGYGQILGKALFNSKRFYASIVTMAAPDDPFIVVPVQQLPAERKHQDVEAQKKVIRQTIVSRQNNELQRDDAAMSLLRELGSDQIIITYAFNFKKNGRINQDPVAANKFNDAIFQKLSIQPGHHPTETPLVVTTSEFDPTVYGNAFVGLFMKRLLQLDRAPASPIVMKYLSSTTMSPWLTATETGNFVPELERCLRAAVLETLKTFQNL